jgi:hypothetical protein
MLCAAEARQALVMGVWQYTDPKFPALPGIESDVAKMTTKLKDIGFNVTVVTNPTLGEAKKAVDDFGAQLLANKGVGLFYFSGHGCENDGKNYLVPKGSAIATRNDLDDEALSAQRILTRMEEAGTSANLVFLDCCRNTLSKGVGDLAPMRATGTFIGFATAAAAAAGAGDSGSAYTTALLEHLASPGLSITDMHSNVTRRVKELTGGAQVPFQYSGLDGIFRLIEGATAPPAPGAGIRPQVGMSKSTPAAGAAAASIPIGDPVAATKEQPYVNTLGMKFVPVPIEGGPTDSKSSGKRVLFCMHETRKGDYRKHAEAVRGVNDKWKSITYWDVPVSQKDDHPVVNVNYEDAVAFCDWLSKTEGREYRLPTDHEWSCAVGIGDQEDPDMNPEAKSCRVKDAYPWGNTWPPPDKAGNYGDATSQEKLKFTDIERYDDGFATTAPVMSFTPNKLGLYDLGGNAWEWVLDWYGTGEINKTLRGESWWSSGGDRSSKLSSKRWSAWVNSYHSRNQHYGFRCVLVVPQ